MDDKGRALGDRKCLFLMTSRCSLTLVFLNSINVFLNYTFLGILQACVMSLSLTFTYLLIQVEPPACFSVGERGRVNPPSSLIQKKCRMCNIYPALSLFPYSSRRWADAGSC